MLSDIFLVLGATDSSDCGDAMAMVPSIASLSLRNGQEFGHLASCSSSCNSFFPSRRPGMSLNSKLLEISSLLFEGAIWGILANISMLSYGYKIPDPDGISSFNANNDIYLIFAHMPFWINFMVSLIYSWASTYLELQNLVRVPKSWITRVWWDVIWAQFGIGVIAAAVWLPLRIEAREPTKTESAKVRERRKRKKVMQGVLLERPSPCFEVLMYWIELDLICFMV